MDLGVLEDAYITSRYVMREFRREEAERLARVLMEATKNLAWNSGEESVTEEGSIR